MMYNAGTSLGVFEEIEQYGSPFPRLSMKNGHVLVVEKLGNIA